MTGDNCRQAHRFGSSRMVVVVANLLMACSVQLDRVLPADVEPAATVE